MIVNHHVLRILYLAAIVLLSGCGEAAKLGEVAGVVNMDGVPVEKGSISFFPVDGQGPTTGTEIVAGKYECQAPLGNCKVEIRVAKIVGTKKLYDTPESPIQNIMEESLPDKYNQATELRLDVQPGKNAKNWDVSTK